MGPITCIQCGDSFYPERSGLDVYPLCPTCGCSQNLDIEECYSENDIAIDPVPTEAEIMQRREQPAYPGALSDASALETLMKVFFPPPSIENTGTLPGEEFKLDGGHSGNG